MIEHVGLLPAVGLSIAELAWLHFTALWSGRKGGSDLWPTYLDVDLFNSNFDLLSSLI